MSPQPASFYDQHALAYSGATFNLALPQLWSLFEDRLHPGATIVDLGCGAGRDVSRFSSRGFQCLGLDRSLPLLTGHAPSPGAARIQADLTTLPLKTDSVDAVWAIGSLHEVAPEHRMNALGEIRRILRHGGAFVVSIRLSRRQVSRSDGRRIEETRPREFLGMLDSAALQVTHAHTIMQPEGPGRGRWLVAVSEAL